VGNALRAVKTHRFVTPSLLHAPRSSAGPRGYQRSCPKGSRYVP
jgi:hypothetical protein